MTTTAQRVGPNPFVTPAQPSTSALRPGRPRSQASPSRRRSSQALARVLDATPAMTSPSVEDVIDAHMDTRFPVNLTVALAVVRHTNR